MEERNRTFQSPYPFYIGMGRIEGGTAANVMAQEVQIHGNLRACTMEDYRKLTVLMEETGRQICTARRWF